MTPIRNNTPDRRTVNAEGRTVTTMTTKRACNGCGQLLGDITDSEMNAAIAGRPLPDVRKECPNCGPTAPEPACVPTKILSGDMYCLDMECGHEHSGEGDASVLEGSYCDEVQEETVCATHSRFVAAEDGFDELVDRAPWPCTKSGAVQR